MWIQIHPKTATNQNLNISFNQNSRLNMSKRLSATRFGSDSNLAKSFWEILNNKQSKRTSLIASERRGLLEKGLNRIATSTLVFHSNHSRWPLLVITASLVCCLPFDSSHGTNLVFT